MRLEQQQRTSTCFEQANGKDRPGLRRLRLTIPHGFAGLQGVHRAAQMRKGYNLTDLPVMVTMATLAAGTAMQLFIADNIELHGLGDGLNFLICLSIVAGAPQLCWQRGPGCRNLPLLSFASWALQVRRYCQARGFTCTSNEACFPLHTIWHLLAVDCSLV